MNGSEPVKSPGGLVRLVRGWWDLQPVIIPALALVLSFAVGAVLMLLVGVNPIEAYWALLRGMYGSPSRLAASIAKSVPFVGSALALAFALRAGLFNIGAQGQMLVGGISAAWVGTWAVVYDLPGVLAVTMVIAAGLLGGAAYGWVPGVLRARTGAHEVISTIMLNSIALFGTTWLVNSSDPVILRDAGSSVAKTEDIAPNARLPELVDSNPPLHVGLFLLIALAVIVWWVLRRTTFGFATITTGTNPHAAHYAGINVNRIIILAMSLSGAFAGMSAASEVAGTNHSFQPGSFAGLGFDGIAIALLARANPLGILAASFLWGSLQAGAPLMQQDAGVSIDVVRIIQAMVLLFVAADAIVRWVFRLRSAPAAKIEVAATGWSAT